MKRWIVMTVPMLLIAAVAFGQLITGGTSGGGSGLSSVTTGNGIQGNGTASSPVALITPIAAANGGCGGNCTVNDFSVPNFYCSAQGNVQMGSANKMLLAQITIPYPLTVSHVSFNVTAGDSTVGHNYDFGLFNSSGALVANTGPTALATATYFYFPLAQGTVSLAPGTYYEGYTGFANIIFVNGCNGVFPLAAYANNAFASPTTTAGTLPTAITVPTAGIVQGTNVFNLHLMQ